MLAEKGEHVLAKTSSTDEGKGYAQPQDSVHVTFQIAKRNCEKPDQGESSKGRGAEKKRDMRARHDRRCIEQPCKTTVSFNNEVDAKTEC